MERHLLNRFGESVFLATWHGGEITVRVVDGCFGDCHKLDNIGAGWVSIFIVNGVVAIVIDRGWDDASGESVQRHLLVDA